MVPCHCRLRAKRTQKLYCPSASKAPRKPLEPHHRLANADLDPSHSFALCCVRSWLFVAVFGKPFSICECSFVLVLLKDKPRTPEKPLLMTVALAATWRAYLATQLKHQAGHVGGVLQELQAAVQKLLRSSS